MTGAEIIKVRDGLDSDRSIFVNNWQEIAEIFTPSRKIGSDRPDLLAADVMFDSTPRQAAEQFTNFLCATIIPRKEEWMQLEPDQELKDDDDATKYYNQSTERIRRGFQSSNLYEEVQEAIHELVTFGTCCLFLGGIDDRGELYYIHLPIGTYYIAEDIYKRVNCVYRDLELTAEQAVQEFGAENLPTEITRKVDKAEGKTEKFKFVHAVYKRTGEIDDNAPDKDKMPWISITVYEKTKKTVKTDGYNEFPFAVCRYSRFANSPWGHGPGSMAKGDARQLNFLNELADIATEKAVFPPIEAPASMEGAIGLGALDINYRKDGDHNQQIHEIHTAARFDVAFQRMQDKREQINKVFYLELFRMFTSRLAAGGTPPSATEASLASNEGFTQFSPVWGRIVSELLDAIINHGFGTYLRAGLLGDPPASVQAVIGGKRRGVALPSITYKNKIVLAQQARQNGSVMEFIGLIGPVLQLVPELAPIIMDQIRPIAMFRDIERNAGFPESWIASKDEAEQSANARAQAQAAQQQLSNGETASKIAANVSKVPGAAQGLGQALTS